MKNKNITILCPKSQFSEVQLQRLEGLGKISFIESKSLKCPKDTEILVVGEDLSKSKLTELLDSLLWVSYLVLGSSDSSCVDFDYCQKKSIIVSSVPFHDAKSKAEYVISLLLACSRRIIINDRRTYRRIYQPEPGFEISGKKLGILGSGLVVEDVVQLARAIGMTVYTTERFDESIRQPLDNLLNDSDLLTLHLPDNQQSKKFLDKERIGKLKEGSIVVNIGNREWVNERAMNEALVSRKVDTYCFTAESMGSSPLKGNEYALMFKPSSTNTVETLESNIEAMVRNIEGIVIGFPFSRVGR
jgi:phosphoglycerate dehydrogenase-like enzyme